MEGKNNYLKFFLAVISIAAFLSAEPSNESIQVKSLAGREYVSVYDLIHAFKLDNSFDIITGRGKLFHRSHTFVFNIDFQTFLSDGRLYKSENPVERHKGEIFLPLDAALHLISAFFPDMKAEVRGNRIDIRTAAISKTGPDKEAAKKIDKPAEKISFIVIDAGHGGKDPGAIGIGGVKEKNITLKVAQALEKKLKAELPNIRVIMIRGSDKFIELSGRTDHANRLLKKNENGIFISLHVNATLSKKISGFETYYLSQNPSNEEARNTAALENNVVILEDQSQKKKYEDVNYIEAMMLTTQILKESHLLADSIQKGLAKNVKVSKSRGVKKADFFVLRGVLMPAVLVEIGFISNAKETKYLQNRSHQKNIVEGISSGIVSFIDRYNRMISK